MIMCRFLCQNSSRRQNFRLKVISVISSGSFYKCCYIGIFVFTEAHAQSFTKITATGQTISLIVIVGSWWHYYRIQQGCTVCVPSSFQFFSQRLFFCPQYCISNVTLVFSKHILYAVYDDELKRLFIVREPVFSPLNWVYFIFFPHTAATTSVSKTRKTANGRNKSLDVHTSL